MGLQQGQELFERTWAVTVTTDRPTSVTDKGVALFTTEHDIKFHIVKSVKSEPNKCKLSIFNLNEDQRAAIEELNPVTPAVSVRDKKKAKIAARKQATRGIPVKIEAGYGGDNELLWLGDMRDAKSEYNAPDWLTELESGDGERAWQNARVNISYGPNTPRSTVFRAMVKALGIGEGNLAKIEKDMTAIIPRGTVISGSVAMQLSDWCRSSDLEWSIQDGAIQFIDRGKALDDRAININEHSGMIKSPTVDVDGILTVEMLMIPGLRPGRLIVVDSRRIQGNFRSERVTWTGDSSGNDWKVKIEARRY